jgi:hypothetical protein
VEFLLCGGAWVERLHPATRSRADMDTFRLTARTSNPANILRQVMLDIVKIIPANSMLQSQRFRRSPSPSPSTLRRTRQHQMHQTLAMVMMRMAMALTA